MLDRITITNAHLLGYSGLQHISVQRGQITSIHAQGESAPPESELTPTLDVAGDWLSLGGVDLQINGGLGLAFPDLTPNTCEKLHAISHFLWQQGVDAFLPTLVTTSVENIQRSLSTLSAFLSLPIPPSPHPPISQILGVHLEGPFLNPEKRGAHPKEHLLPLTIANVQRVLGEYTSLIKVITLAPELDETGDVIPYLRSLGITVSLGHSLATAAQAQRAFDQGATMVTHAFNAMPPLHHREPGLLGAAIVYPSVHCGLIADGQHVAPIMADILLRSARCDQGVFLVSDALAPLGLPDGVYPWDTRQIDVTHGTARLLDGTLAGTTLPLLVGVQNLLKWGICDLEPAIALATIAPRRALELTTDYIGQPAHLLRWQLEAGEVRWDRLKDKGK